MASSADSPASSTALKSESRSSPLTVTSWVFEGMSSTCASNRPSAGQASRAPKFGGSVQPRAQRIDQKGGPGRQKNGAKEQKSTGHPFPPEPFLNRVQRTASSTCGRSSPANGRAA